MIPEIFLEMVPGIFQESFRSFSGVFGRWFEEFFLQRIVGECEVLC
jgi:hypothetical protein